MVINHRAGGSAPATGLLDFRPMGLGSICLASLRRLTSFGLSRPTDGVEVLQGAGEGRGLNSVSMCGVAVGAASAAMVFFLDKAIAHVFAPARIIGGKIRRVRRD